MNLATVKKALDLHKGGMPVERIAWKLRLAPPLVEALIQNEARRAAAPAPEPEAPPARKGKRDGKPGRDL
jgi:hypothetical protein